MQSVAITDLTHSLEEGSPGWPGMAPFSREAGLDGAIMTIDEHLGTHLDSPAGFLAGATTVDRLPVERLHAPLVVVDVRRQVQEGDGDYFVGLADIERHDNVCGVIPHGAVVVALTGWDRHWGEPERYLNRRSESRTLQGGRGAQEASGGAVDGGLRLPRMHNPGWSPEAVAHLIRKFEIVGLGIDALSVDGGREDQFPVHQLTAAAGAYNLENLCNLHLVPPAGARIVVAPLKVKGATAAPARVLVLFDPAYLR